jgi:hypothetical protein
MTKKVLIALFVCLTCLSVQAQAQTSSENWFGGEFGCLVQRGERPVMAYAITKDFSLKKVPLIGDILSKFSFAEGWEGSVLYSDRNTVFTRETYAARFFNYKVFAISQGTFKGFFTGMGFGSWTMTNTDGDDVTYVAGKGGIGWAVGPFVARIAGDVVGTPGDNLYFVHGGLLFNL